MRYAVTPRFALSCSEAMLAGRESSLGTHGDLLFTSHINETTSSKASGSRSAPTSTQGHRSALFSEALSAYEGQRLRTDGQRLGPVALLYLATRAGAQSLGLHGEVGDLPSGRAPI